MARQENPPEDSDVVVLRREQPAETLPEESAELYFLIANFLTNASPCSRAATVLQQELRERGLLGTAYDWESNARPASFDDVRRRHRTLPADQLVRVASR
ncbi:unnamed protein product, partial [Laminaria digitata]